MPTKVEQGDLLTAMFGAPGDSPKVIIAAATISECFHFVTLARRLAESFRMPVMVLTDANLATGVQPFERPDQLPLGRLKTAHTGRCGNLTKLPKTAIPDAYCIF